MYFVLTNGFGVFQASLCRVPKPTQHVSSKSRAFGTLSTGIVYGRLALCVVYTKVFDTLYDVYSTTAFHTLRTCHMVYMRAFDTLHIAIPDNY